MNSHEQNPAVFRSEDDQFIHHPVDASRNELFRHLNQAHPDWEVLAASSTPSPINHEALHRAGRKEN